MPDKSMTVLTYAASASLAAVALVYFFNPNYLIDNDAASSSANARKKGVVGLQNPLNDCFINSVLQALAGLGDLRLYLIRELHRRKLSGPEIYRTLPEEDDDEKPLNKRKCLSLQSGEVTQALKLILDQLNERPLQKKTISAGRFIAALERAFETRLSKDQQDAQELLQVVAERVCDEYHAGRQARKRARIDISRKNSVVQGSMNGLGLPAASESRRIPIAAGYADLDEEEGEEEPSAAEEERGFPLEGQTQSTIECQQCHFIPKSPPVSFVMLTLSVPQTNSATLNECFDAHFKREIIDDYKCDRCRLEHAISIFQKDLAREISPHARQEIQSKISRLRQAILEDPEKPPKDIKLPDSSLAPARKIERHVKMTQFPQILVIHLSRSIFNMHSSSVKNLAKVSFPERLPLGGLLDRRNYKLLGMIGHKGTHNSGHYECFRRQHVYAPYSNPHADPELGPYSQLHTPSRSAVSSPKIPPSQASGTTPIPTPPGSSTDLRAPSQIQPPYAPPPDPSTAPSSSSQSLLSNPHSEPSTRPSSASLASPSSLPKHHSSSTLQSPLSATMPASPPSDATIAESRRDSSATATSTSRARNLVDSSVSKLSMGIGSGSKKRRKKGGDRWWRISDDKVRECKTAEVLRMEREVYLLFYEMERPEPGG